MNSSIEYLKTIATNDLIQSKRKAVHFFFKTLYPAEVELSNLDEKIGNICDNLELLSHDETSPEFIALHDYFESLSNKEEKLIRLVNQYRETYKTLFTAKESYLRIFPDLKREIFHEVARLYENDRCKEWEQDLERRRRKLERFYPETRDEWEEYNMEINELMLEEKEITKSSYLYYQNCIEILFQDKSNPRSHILNIFPWNYYKNN
jgi:hypothetical protein